MKVKLTRAIHGARGSFAEGAVIDVSEEASKQLISAGAATPVKAREAVEAATVEPEETATLPRPGGRRPR